MQDEIRKILIKIGEDPERQGLKKTPLRYEKALLDLTKGYSEDPNNILSSAMFEEDYDEMVLIRDIEIFSLCEHHLLPFFGKCYIAYIPDRRIVGLSKLARIVDVFAKRLQVQERLTMQIAKTIDECLKPLGVGVVIEAKHLCMVMRGVEKQNSVAVTSAMFGCFRDEVATRNEFFNLIKIGNNR